MTDCANGWRTDGAADFRCRVGSDLGGGCRRLHRDAGAERLRPGQVQRLRRGADPGLEQPASARRRGDGQLPHPDHRQSERRRPARPAAGADHRSARRDTGADRSPKTGAPRPRSTTTPTSGCGRCRSRPRAPTTSPPTARSTAISTRSWHSGTDSSNGWLAWAFAGLFVVGLLELTASIIYAVRSREAPSPAPPSSPRSDVGDLHARQRLLHADRRRDPLRSAQKPGSAARFRRADRGGVRGREAPDPGRLASTGR